MKKQGVISKTEDGKIFVRLAKEFYEQQAVFAAAHKLTDRFSVMIEPVDDYTVGVYLEPKRAANFDEDEIETIVFEFCNDLLDEQVRLDLDKRFGALRDLIVKQAFSPLTATELSKKVGELKNK